MNKIVSVLVVVIVLVVGFILFKNKGVAPASIEVEGEASTSIPGENTSGTSSPMPAPGNEGVEEMIVEDNVKEFVVDATSFSFSPSTMVVDRGDTVKITLKNAKGVHDLKIDEFTGASTRILNAGESETITFVADKSGTFEYYCSVGNHRAMGMVGTLTVR